MFGIFLIRVEAIDSPPTPESIIPMGLFIALRGSFVAGLGVAPSL